MRWSVRAVAATVSGKERPTARLCSGLFEQTRVNININIRTGVGLPYLQATTALMPVSLVPSAVSQMLAQWHAEWWSLKTTRPGTTSPARTKDACYLLRPHFISLK